MEKNSLQTAHAVMKKKALDELASVVESIYEATVVNNQTSTIPEVVFVEYFLDFFKNQMNTPDRDLKYSKWIELSGSPYNEVNVIDNSGNHIYTIPPIYAKPVIADAVINTNFSNIANTYMLKHNRLVKEGTQYLDDELKKVAKGISSSSEEIVARWISIFKRYQEPPIVQHPVLKESTISDDDIEY